MSDICDITFTINNSSVNFYINTCGFDDSPVSTNFRITEDNDIRITEDNDNRILE